MNFRGRNRLSRYAAIFVLVMVAFATAGMALVLPGGANSPATVLAADTTLGVDADTAGNSASSLGAIESCKQVNVGDPFDVDLYITEVSGMRSWEYYLSFDTAKIHITAQAFQMINGFDASDPVPDSNSPHFFGNGQGAPVSGSGVLARVTFEADATGVAIIAISHNPLWPILDSGNGKIGDTTGDGFFDGALIAGSVAIGQACPAGPIVTATPGPTVTIAATATPVPTAVPTPTPAPPMRGDSTCDGQITLADVIATLNGATEIAGSGNCSQRGDANCSGILDADDALRELRFIAQSPLTAPVGCQPVGDPIPLV